MDLTTHERWMDEYFFTGIVPSKHLYFTKDKRIRHQNKAHDISIENYAKWRKSWLVYHLVAGSRSGRFALQIADKPNHDLLVMMLRRCFEGTQDVIIDDAEYEDHVLSGKPTIGTVVPKGLQRSYPSLTESIQAMGSNVYSIAKGGGFKNPIVHLTRTLNEQVVHQANPYDEDTNDFKAVRFDDEVLSGFSDVMAEYLSLRSQAYMMWGWRRKDGSFCVVDRD